METVILSQIALLKTVVPFQLSEFQNPGKVHGIILLHLYSCAGITHLAA